MSELRPNAVTRAPDVAHTYENASCFFEIVSFPDLENGAIAHHETFFVVGVPKFWGVARLRKFAGPLQLFIAPADGY